MEPIDSITQPGLPQDYPDRWDIEELHRRWTDLLMSVLKEEQIPLPLKRVQNQVRQNATYQEITRRWEAMNGNERLSAWKSLIELSEDAIRSILPACVGCGECCRRGSPTLQLEDLELLKQGGIPWGKLYTLRRGEPVRSPHHEKLLFLTEERIKIREKPGAQECCFFDSESDQCGIYPHRPIQCRAQACWDPKAGLDLAKTPHLTRLDIFSGVELLLDLMDEHDRRCAFAKLEKALGELEETRGESVDEVLKLLAYEDHFRSFLGTQLNIPDENLELVFGRSFADLVCLFGFRVVTEPSGARCLVPDK